MIDLHTHILPGLDDGPDTLEESVELARAFVAEGVTIVAGTPHVRYDHATSVEAMEAARARLRAALEAGGIPLDVRGGGEVAIDELELLNDHALAGFGLAGNPGLVLLEFPYYGWPLPLETIVYGLRERGIVPVLAHPERNAEVAENPERLRPVVQAGAYVQLTASSLDGSAGSALARCAKRLLETGLAHILASDWHGKTVRRSGLRAGAAAAGDPALAVWLTETVPRALIEGSPPPPRPSVAVPPRRRLWHRG